MGRSIGGPEALATDVGVALGCGDVGVPQQLLDRSQVGPTVEQVGGEAVAEGVGMGR